MTQQQDVTDSVGNNIALIIDILWVTALAGMVASLSFAEWQHSRDVSTRAQADRSGIIAFLGCTALLTASLFVGGWYGSLPTSLWALLLLAILSALSIIQTITALRRRMRATSHANAASAATPAI